MATVNEKFAQALRTRLNGKSESLLGEHAGKGMLALARAAEVAPEILAAAAAEALGHPFTDCLSDRPVSHRFVTSVPISYARDHGMIGLAGDNGAMVVALADLAQWSQLEVLRRVLGQAVKPLFAPRPEILRAVNVAYQQESGRAQRVIEQLDGGDIATELKAAARNEDLLDVAGRAPVIKLVNLLLFEAVKRRASDVHIQPYEDRLLTRFRVDGVLYDVFEPPKALHAEIISRIKVMAGMNIAERRLAQDGRATVEVGDRVVDLRVATLPTCFGERAVIRLLDKSVRLYNLPDLGMPENVLEGFDRLLRRDHGIILVTGPTGSGKSTTLYAGLQEVDSRELNVVTLEDPIEYRLEGISQTQISEKKGMTFATGLRHVLRQDPDIIMVGEVRDPETAQMAIQSALTGHLVLSTLHTNDAAGAVARMMDLGIEAYLLASALLGVLAQRLVRKICPHCREVYEPTEREFRLWGVAPESRLTTYYRGKGCSECLHTGYRERLGIFELLIPDEQTRELILARAKASSIKGAARQVGMTTLRTDGIAKAARGLTTMEEVARVAGRDDF